MQQEVGFSYKLYKGSKLQWFGHVMGKHDENTIKAVMKRKPGGKRPRGRKVHRWLDVVQYDLGNLAVIEEIFLGPKEIERREG